MELLVMMDKDKNVITATLINRQIRQINEK